MTKTKIICTLGPASSGQAVLSDMMRAGMSAVRLNFSHGDYKEHLGRIRKIRILNKKCRRQIKILGDLEGYRIRVGKFKGGRPVQIKKGQVVWLLQKDVQGEGNVIPFEYSGPLSKIKKGQHIYIDDGKIDLIVDAYGKDRLKTRAGTSGLIKERKGINMPGVRLDFEGLSAKDKRDVNFCLEQGIDYIAQSFVRSKEDVLVLKEYISGHSRRPKVIAKIENREGIKNIDDIIKFADGIIVARGDMGVAIPIYEVPIVQKEIIKKCNKAKKPVMIATQMLESMIENLRPTRADVADVANAILDGADYTMLSAETAVGQYPSEAVAMMHAVIKFAERSAIYKRRKA